MAAGGGGGHGPELEPAIKAKSSPSELMLIPFTGAWPTFLGAAARLSLSPLSATSYVLH